MQQAVYFFIIKHSSLTKEQKGRRQDLIASSGEKQIVKCKTTSTMQVV